VGLLGAHVSIAGGIEKAIRRGEALGCDAIQVFSKNQRQWDAPPLKEASAAVFLKMLEGSTIQEVVVHDSYLINLANPAPGALEKSRTAFLDEMKRADGLGARYLVFHPGSHMKTGEEEGLRRVAESLNVVLDRQPEGRVQLLLETTAGQGNHLGCRFEALATIFSLVENKNRVGVCYDTAHVFEAGYVMRTKEAYDETFSVFDRVVGLDRLRVFHLNDSKSERGSRVDRHEQIGEGFIGLEPFRFLVNDTRFRRHPMILETPGGEDHYRKSLDILRSLIV